MMQMQIISAAASFTLATIAPPNLTNNLFPLRAYISTLAFWRTTIFEIRIEPSDLAKHPIGIAAQPRLRTLRYSAEKRLYFWRVQPAFATTRYAIRA